LRVYTAREISDLTGFSIHKIKRWAVAFLGIDPITGQHSGQPRLYTPTEVRKLLCGGVLVYIFHMPIVSAKAIIDNVRYSKWKYNSK
jgi:hypothetical protein